MLEKPGARRYTLSVIKTENILGTVTFSDDLTLFYNIFQLSSCHDPKLSSCHDEPLPNESDSIS